MRHPINKCKQCGKPLVKMRKIAVKGGYYLFWNTQSKYCSHACYQRAWYWERKRKRIMNELGI